MKTVFVLVFRLLPKNLLSRVTGRLVSLHLPEPLKRMSLSWFQKRFKINMAEADKYIYEYACIGDLFTRKLKPGLRPIGPEPVHPVDGRLTNVESVIEGQLHQVKGFSYSMVDLVRRPADLYTGATMLTYYLCPTDYHRVHSPVSGKIKSIHGIAGELWPVNDMSVSSVPRLFARNERVILDIETEKGTVLLIMVGATNVGQMSLSCAPEFRSNTGKHGAFRKNYEQGLAIQAGQELGIFHMGSTVLVVWPQSFGAKIQELKKLLGPVKLGQSLRRYFQ